MVRGAHDRSRSLPLPPGASRSTGHKLLILDLQLWNFSSCAESCLELMRFFPKQFTVRGSQCFKEWSPWCWMVWSGSRPACLPLLGASGRVPGWLVSHFLSFVSHFFSFVSQAGCLWSGSRLACLPLPFICLPLLFICLPVLICLPGWVRHEPFSFSFAPKVAWN